MQNPPVNRPRYLETPVARDLEEKMVFVAGPRQVGKTTLARRILATHSGGIYLNWDNRQDRQEIRAARWPAAEAMVVLDEIHKWRPWKSWLKGEYDRHRDHLHFLVTGSARLDVYRRGGDSLQGRYHHHRLHPFSCAEAEGGKPEKIEAGKDLPIERSAARDTIPALLEFGGFPEPFLSGSKRTLRRWQKDRVERFFREDVRDLELVRDLGSMELLSDLLPDRVGSPLSLNSLREDLEVSHRAVALWMEIFERLYFVFTVRPFVHRATRALRKMPKAYLWDSGLVSDRAARYENLVASHLLKLCHFLQDVEGYRADLWYLRDRVGRETDFLITLDRKPWVAVEAKLSASEIDRSLLYFRDRLKIPYVYQVVLEGDRDFVQHDARCLPARKFLNALV
jgi:hypothetical protein